VRVVRDDAARYGIGGLVRAAPVQEGADREVEGGGFDCAEGQEEEVLQEDGLG
jgi:hypothetical protein